MDVTTKEGDFQNYHGTAGIGLIDGRLQLEGPIIKNRTSFNFGIRRTWMDLVTAPMQAIQNAKTKKDGEKYCQGIALANDLYAKINNTDEEDLENLRLLRKEAEKNLEINFFDKKLLRNLINITNPKRYMEPYDAEKVKVANQLHTQLRNQKHGIKELEIIEKEIQEKLLNS